MMRNQHPLKAKLVKNRTSPSQPQNIPTFQKSALGVFKVFTQFCKNKRIYSNRPKVFEKLEF